MMSTHIAFLLVGGITLAIIAPDNAHATTAPSILVHANNDVNDHSINTFPVSGSPNSFVAGKLNQAANFTSDQSIQYTGSSALDAPSDFTLYAWFNTTTTPSSGYGFWAMDSGNINLRMNPSGGIEGGILGQGHVRGILCGGTSCADGNWHLAVFRHNSVSPNIDTFCVDDVCEDENVGPPVAFGRSNWNFGRYQANLYFRGYLDESGVVYADIGQAGVDLLWNGGAGCEVNQNGSCGTTTNGSSTLQLIAHFNGSTTDSSTNAYFNEPDTGTVQYVPGKLGQAALFDPSVPGGTNYNYQNYPALGTSDFSISAWVNVTAAAGITPYSGSYPPSDRPSDATNAIVSVAGNGGSPCKGGAGLPGSIGYIFGIANDKAQFQYCYSPNGTDDASNEQFSLESNAVVADGSWHFIAITRQASLLSLYVDGLLDVTASTPNTINFDFLPASQANLVDGLKVAEISTTFSIPAQARFNGLLDEFAIFDRALPASEVGCWYNGGTGREVDQSEATCANIINATGVIGVATNLSAATFTLTGAGSFSGGGTNKAFDNVPVGTYTIAFGAVSGYVTPVVPTQTLTAGGTVTFTGTYKLAAGNINVATNTDSATFIITGPVTRSGSGKSVRFIDLPPGNYTISYGPACRSDLPPSETKLVLVGGTTIFTGTFSPGFLIFPLAGLDPCSAQINSVFDHSQNAPYTNDFKVVAYTGETGVCGASNPVQDFQSVVRGKHPHSGYRNQTGSPFAVNGNYSGGENGNGSPARTCAGASATNLPSATFLFYDGHPGYDYQAICGTPVYAAVSGTVTYPASIPGLKKNAETFHVLELDPDFPNSTYKVYYLHLSTYPSSKSPSCKSAPPIIPPKCKGKPCHVNAGQLIGMSGDAGVSGSPHLHFEIQVTPGIPVDPYGWKGAIRGDPYKRATSTNLWF